MSLLDTLNGKYGLVPSDHQDIGECRENPLIVPKLRRYLGMGLFEIIAEVKDHQNKFFAIEVGGPNGYEAEYNQAALLRLTLDQAITFDELMTHLKTSSWTQILSVDQGDENDVHHVIEHKG